MARGTMHQPKPEGQRRRRNAPAHGETILPRDDEVRGPELADLMPGRPFSEGTLAWFDDWRRSPQAAVFERTDWRRLGVLALVYDAILKRPSAALLAELRMSEERLGATFTDRQRARMRIEDDAEGDDLPAGVASIKDARAALRRRQASGE